MMAKRVEFRPPSGATPEGLTSGEEFDAVCTFLVKENGTICLTQLGDVKMPGYDDKSAAPHKPEYSPPDQSEGY